MSSVHLRRRRHNAAQTVGIGQRLILQSSILQGFSPFQANTGTPVLAMAAAAWSWVEKMLQEATGPNAQLHEGFDEHRGLHRHVQGSVIARQRVASMRVFLAHAMSRAFLLGDFDGTAAKSREREITDPKVLRGGGGRGRRHWNQNEGLEIVENNGEKPPDHRAAASRSAVRFVCSHEARVFRNDRNGGCR